MTAVLFPAFAHHSVIAYASMLLVVCCARLSVMDTTELEQLLLAAVVDALAAAHIEWKVAAATMRIDYGQMVKQLRSEPQQYLALTRLFRLPFTFWVAFTPALMTLLYKKRLQEVQQSIADLTRRAS
jgi:hypothetical protein